MVPLDLMKMIYDRFKVYVVICLYLIEANYRVLMLRYLNRCPHCKKEMFHHMDGCLYSLSNVELVRSGRLISFDDYRGIIKYRYVTRVHNNVNDILREMR